MRESLIKTLSGNDVGETGSHQAGILVPKVPEVLKFFPPLDEELTNPRVRLAFTDQETGDPYELNFIHYNGRRHGSSTRDEYRLTGMTRFLRMKGARSGDQVHLARSAGGYTLSLHRQGASSSPALTSDDDVIVLSGAWVTIQKGRSS